MEEKEGGSTSMRHNIEDFQAMLDKWELKDLGYLGTWYTWERGVSVSTRVRERLDRFVGSTTWCSLFPGYEVTHLMRYKSDHMPTLLRAYMGDERRRRKPKWFKFETCWLLEESCESVVREVWEQAWDCNVVGKVAGVARGLRNWSSNKFDGLGKQIKEVEGALKVAQRKPITQESCEECIKLERILDDLNEKHEAYWYLRSRVAEVKDGDKNTKYFHHKASQRRRRNEIKGLFDEEGGWKTEATDLENIFCNYYGNLFASGSPTEANFNKVLEHVKPSITGDMNERLLKPYTKDEVFGALCEMLPCKAPGPDGMHAIFYQKFWHIVGEDVTKYVSKILHEGCFPEEVNNTNVALIPKVKQPTTAAEFRPISLCNVLYKLVSKCIVRRLKDILVEIITENQSAFVPGRLIIDNALITLELFHSMKKRSRSRKGYMAVKLDMSKAYDRVEWGFLRQLLLKMGFDGRWVNLIMSCVSTVKYSFVINGEVCGSVTPTRGLRQGDPLSPYLFIIVADAFSYMLYEKVRSGHIHGAKASHRGPKVSYLLFADDSLLFARANRRECSSLVEVLNQYEAASGKKINHEKSEVSFSKGVKAEQRDEIQGILRMRLVDKHEKYLGIPNIIRRSKRRVFDSLLDRVWKKSKDGKRSCFRGRERRFYLKSVIQAIPTFVMSIYKLPSEIIEKIHSAMDKFWWRQNDDKRKIHWKSWDSMCTPKCLGGMGFRDLEVFNQALLGRQAWRLIKKPGSLLERVFKGKYFPNGEFLEASLGYNTSHVRRGI
ncbi:LINE-1 retrotransposable element ORF2 protein [Bienertia sinuspersici]